MEYRKIGSFIKPISEKNIEGEYSEVLGVAIEKEFMPSVANINGTDLKKYSILRKNRFAFNPMHVGRDKKLPIALYLNDEPALVSPAYNMFEIIDDSINIKYLMLLFKTKQFDHLCWFYTDSSVRGGLSWEDFCNIELNIPELIEQKKILKISEIFDNRIKVLNEINDNLKTLINLIYKEIFREEYPSYRLDEISKVTIGKTPSRDDEECFTTEDKDIKWVSISDLGKCGVYISETAEKLTKEAINEYNIKVIPKNTILLSFKLTVGRIAITNEKMATNEAIAHIQLNDVDYLYYLYSYLNNFDYNNLGNTSSIATAVNSKIIKAMPVLIPDNNIIKEYNKKIEPIFKKINENESEIDYLKKLKNIVISGFVDKRLDV